MKFVSSCITCLLVAQTHCDHTLPSSPQGILCIAALRDREIIDDSAAGIPPDLQAAADELLTHVPVKILLSRAKADVDAKDTLKHYMNPETGACAEFVHDLQAQVGTKIQERFVQYSRFLSPKIQVDSLQHLNLLIQPAAELRRFKRFECRSSYSYGFYHTNLQELMTEMIGRVDVKDLHLGPRVLHFKMEEKEMAAVGSVIFSTTSSTTFETRIELSDLATAAFGIVTDGGVSDGISNLGNDPLKSSCVVAVYVSTGEVYVKGQVSGIFHDLRFPAPAATVRCTWNSKTGEVTFALSSECACSGHTFKFHKGRKVRAFAAASAKATFSDLQSADVEQLHWDRHVRHPCVKSKGTNDLYVQPERAITDPASGVLHNKICAEVQQEANITEGLAPVAMLWSIFLDGTLTNGSRGAKPAMLRLQSLREGSEVKGSIRPCGLAPYGGKGSAQSKMNELQEYVVELDLLVFSELVDRRLRLTPFLLPLLGTWPCSLTNWSRWKAPGSLSNCQIGAGYKYSLT
jgi:hypothetical protein